MTANNMISRVLKYVAIVTLVLPCRLMASEPVCKVQDLLYKDKTKPIPMRVDDLMSRMTLEEKVAQMCQYVGPGHIRQTMSKFKGKKMNANNDANGVYPNLTIDAMLKLVEEGKIGSFLHVVDAEESNMLQALAMKSRLQIPLLIGIDAIHGDALVKGTTVFPTTIGQAASFNTRLVEKISKDASAEVRAMGAHWTFTPNIDVARDARWGRVGETFGEDPYLVAQMGVATIKGYQGNNPEHIDVLACAKHLIAGSEPINGTNASPMDISERTLREIYMPPYKAAVDAGVATVMAAHNEVNGIPCHANKWLMQDVLRDEYGFKGFVVSDWMDIERIYSLHHVASSKAEAHVMSADAGVDMHMHGPGFMEAICDAVKNHQLDEQIVNRACRAILEAKFRLGLFENPYVNLKNSARTVFSKRHQKDALDMARQSIVLLENRNAILPLDPKKYNNILVTGPNANSHAILGDWTFQQPEENVVTILEGLQKEIGMDKIKFYDYGSNVKAICPDKVKEAAKMAESSDLAIIVVGENPLRYQKTKTSGENIDRMTLDLLGSQEDLVEAIEATGIPVIVVLVGGRPLGVTWISEHADALIQAWEPGSFGGTAVAEIVTGKTNPSAKLPITMPRHSGQIPIMYNQKPSHNFHTYIDGQHTPLYPFGYGLNYSDFSISNLKLSDTVISAEDSLTVTCKVKNASSREGVEVVQLYIRDCISSVTRPVLELKGFQRVSLSGNSETEISFTITPDMLSFYDRNMEQVIEKGEFTISVGSSSLKKDLQSMNFSIE